MSAEEIPGRVPGYDFEMLNDLLDLLRRRSTPEMPLADLFMSILEVREQVCNGAGSAIRLPNAGRQDHRPDDFAVRPDGRITGRYCI